MTTGQQFSDQGCAWKGLPACPWTTPICFAPAAASGRPTAPGGRLPEQLDHFRPPAGWSDYYLAQGLYYALWHLVSAYLLARGGEAAKVNYWDNTLAGLLMVQALQAASLFIGGMLSAAGRRRGLIIGASLGLVNALLLVALPLVSQRPTDEVNLYVQPVLHAFVGAIGGAVGSRVWQPRPELPPLTGDGKVGREMLTTILPERATEVFGIDPLAVDLRRSRRGGGRHARRPPHSRSRGLRWRRQGPGNDTIALYHLGNHTHCPNDRRGDGRPANKEGRCTGSGSDYRPRSSWS